jgi:hypothetical protein
VYHGRERVREYLHALGDGRKGLAPGQLNEHLQLMPVVTLADDGRSARGTWRDVILAGQLGRSAFWGEGPFENEYVKEDGVWKISRLHWYQTLYVPYEDGGWARHEDVNGARFVGARLTPDAPTSVAYKSWPGAYTPRFHFAGRLPRWDAIASTVPPEIESAATTARSVARLRLAAERLTDHDAVENLQRIYGYYIDKGLWSEAAALFADRGTLATEGRGEFRGKARVLEYLRAIGPEGLQEGRLYDNMQLQPVVHVSADGRTAKGRWRLFGQYAISGQFHEWATGIYENEYVKEEGVWKILRLHLYPTMVTPYEEGWGKVSQSFSKFEPQLTPDAPCGRLRNYESVFVPPFHYRHPVRYPARDAPSRVRATTDSSLPEQLDEIERLITAAEDHAAIEQLQAIYGYYLATLQWDHLAELFADDGTIEIALRGVYKGRASVRRNLDLYGQAGLDNGVLHNHMQFQPVISIAPDGRTANLRSRAFSMMGNFGQTGTWMGGLYENEFVKEDGVWKFKKDHVFNTYFAPYATGWKTLATRAPPGITAANPPDAPPSVRFDMFPKNFLPPFHYPNPVTGRAYSP